MSWLYDWGSGDAWCLLLLLLLDDNVLADDDDDAKDRMMIDDGDDDDDGVGRRWRSVWRSIGICLNIIIGNVISILSISKCNLIFYDSHGQAANQ